MDWTNIIITLLAGTNVTTLIFFFATFRAKKKKENAEADIKSTEANLRELDYTEKIISIYNKLSADQRIFYDSRITELNIKIEALKTKIASLESERCSNNDCPNRKN